VENIAGEEKIAGMRRISKASARERIDRARDCTDDQD